MVVLLFAACASGPKGTRSGVAWDEMPRLPSPTSATYAIVPAKPPDPGVAYVLGGRPWDASLGGAAAALALAVVTDRGSITPPEVREAAWRAGWPYPVLEVRAWTTQAGQPPPDEVKAWLLQWDGASIGLVRARGGLDDVWIGLASRPVIDLGPVPRQVPKGGSITVPAVPGAIGRVADPEGAVRSGELTQEWSSTLELEGEWLFEIERDGFILARFPLYVGLVPPDIALLVPSAPPQDAPNADALAVTRLAEVRDAYGLPPLERDPMLDAASRTVVSAPDVGPEVLATRAGIPPGELWRFTCSAQTVETCLDKVVWRVDARTGLLAEEGLFGLTSAVSPKGVELALVVALAPVE
jgi:hypothetical protein